MTGTSRSGDGLDPRRRRLKFRSWHRGIREMDLIMGRFADACIDHLSEAELGELELLMEVPDTELFSWIIGMQPVPAAYDNAVLRRMRAFHHNSQPAS
jgi:antitoxin CptB